MLQLLALTPVKMCFLTTRTRSEPLTAVTLAQASAGHKRSLKACKPSIEPLDKYLKEPKALELSEVLAEQACRYGESPAL